MSVVPDGYYQGVMARIGAPWSGNIQAICHQWQAFEGGNAAWNSWNTTTWEAGATDYNTAGVKNYPDEATGIRGTADTLLNGFYPDVVASFRNDLPMNQWGDNPDVLAQINTWGTHGFAHYLQSVAGGAQQAGNTQPTGNAGAQPVSQVPPATGLDESGTMRFMAGNPSGYVLSTDEIHVYTVNKTTGHLYHQWAPPSSGFQPVAQDLTADLKTPGCDPASDVLAYFDSTRNQHEVFALEAGTGKFAHYFYSYATGAWSYEAIG